MTWVTFIVPQVLTINHSYFYLWFDEDHSSDVYQGVVGL